MANSTINGINITIGGTDAGLSAAVNSAVNSLNRLAPASSAAAAGITNLTQAVQSGQASFANLNRTVLESSGDMVRLNRSVNQTAQYLGQLAQRQREFITAARQGQLSYVGLNGAITNAGQGMTRFNNNVGNGTNTLTQFSRIAQDAPFGIQGIGNNITATAESFGALVRSTGSASAALRAVVSSLTGVGGILLAISTVTSVVTVLTAKYGSLGNAYDALFVKLTAEQKAQKALNDAREKGLVNADAELVTLAKLYRATQNSNISLEQRNAIVDKLQKQYPAYFGNLSNEAILAGNASDAYKRLRDSIIAVAQSKAIEEELVNQAKASRELKKDYNDLVRAQLNLYNSAQKIRLELDELAAKGVTTGTYVRKLTDEYLRLNNQAQSYNDKLSANRDRQAEAANLTERLAQENQDLAEKFKEVTTGFDQFKEPKKITTVTDVLNDLNTAIEKTNALFYKSGDTLQQLTNNQIRNYENALKALIDINVKPGDKIFDQLRARLESLNTIAAGRPTDIKVPVTVTPVPTVTTSNNLTKVFNTEVGKWQTAFEKSVDSFNPNLDQFSFKLQGQLETLFKSGFAEMGAGIATAVGDILSGAKPLSAALNSLVGIVADFAISFGKALVTAGTATLAAKVLIKNPVTAIAAGALAITAGTILKNAAAKAPSFAQGGIVTEPTYARIGDNPGRKEAVIPSELWPLLGGGGAQVFIPDARISGSDIVISYNRTIRNENRTR